jgi:hypothetical protein
LGEVDIAATGAEGFALEFRKAAVESLMLTSTDASRDRPELRADWMPLDSARSQYKPSARTAAFSAIPPSQPLDDDLVNAIAIDTVPLVDPRAASTVHPWQVDTESDDVDDSENPRRQLLARRGAFRPVVAPLVS